MRETRETALLVLVLGLGAAAAAASSASAAAGTDTLTVEECVAEARRSAPALLAADLDRQAAAGDSAVRSVNRRPDFWIATGALVAPEGFYDPVLTNLGDYELKLGMGWTLADGGRRARERERGGLDVAAARGRLALESRDAGLRAAELSFELLRLREVERAQRQAIEWLEGLGVLVRAGVASGARSSADSIRVALERDDAEAGLEGTRLGMQTAGLEILALLGRGAAAPLNLREPHATAEEGPSEADSARLVAGVERLPEVALARVAEAETRLDLADARQSAAPSVELSLDAGLAGADLTSAVPPDLKTTNPDATFADRLRRDLGASAAVRLRWPLRSPTVLPAVRARQATLGAVRVRAGAEAASQQRQALVLLAVWRSAAWRLRAAEITSDRAERNLLKVKSLYAAGAMPLLDLLDARRVYADARVRLAGARADTRSARFRVEDRR
jgi:outer membrane protein TolC